MTFPYLNRRLRTIGEVTVHAEPASKPFLMDASEVCISSKDAKPKRYSLFLELCVVAIIIGALTAALH